MVDSFLKVIPDEIVGYFSSNSLLKEVDTASIKDDIFTSLDAENSDRRLETDDFLLGADPQVAVFDHAPTHSSLEWLVENAPTDQLESANLVESLESIEFVPGEVIVKLKNGINIAAVGEIQASIGATTLQTTQTLGIQLWSVPQGIEEVVQAYSNDPRIEYIEPNYTITLDSTIPDDSSFSSLWGLNNTGQTGGVADADIDAPEAWEIQTGNDVVVGVIDTGIDYTHPDLVNNMWTNPGEIPGNGLDDDLNGYVDDVYGYDFAYNDGDPFDRQSHGTHVAGTIAAESNNGQGVTGVSWDAQLMAIQFLDDSGRGSTFNAIRAVEYATMMGAQLTNNSWGGGGFSQGLHDAIEAAGKANSLFIAAAGNNSRNTDASPYYPANYELDNVISVAATDHHDNLSWFSNYGATTVDLGAPGSSIYSTVPGGGYAYKNGTSMAAPHVAGVASLLWSEDPSLSASEVKQAILDSSDPIAALDGKTLSGGRLNALNALNQIDTPDGDLLNDDFDPDIDNSQWSQISNGVANANFGGSSNSLFFTRGNWGDPYSRFATSKAMDLSSGGTISFDLIFGTDSNGGEKADRGEDVVLEYSTDGSTWTPIALYDTEEFTRWTTITQTLPTAAQTSNTSLRWRQVSHGGYIFDNWGIDNVKVLRDSSVTIGLQDDFDPDVDDRQWSDMGNVSANSNFGGSGKSLFFTAGNWGDTSRYVTTKGVNVADGGTISFDLIFGNSSNGGENADSGEDVALEYSTNGGSTWTRIALYDTEDYTRWSSISQSIPAPAQTDDTQFRWLQVAHSGSNFDQWAIDNVAIEAF